MSINWPVITCAVCNKPVDSLEWWEEDGDPRAGRRQFLRAYCHGQQDMMWVAPDELPFEVAMQLAQTPGLAFVREAAQ